MTELSVPAVHAIVPAAGLSRRMGRSKLDLDLFGKPIINHVLHSLAESKLASLHVVLGPATKFLTTILDARAQALVMDEPTADMRYTVEFALRRIEKELSPLANAGWLLAPADHPYLPLPLLHQLLAEFAKDPTRIVVPSVAEKSVHPIIFPWTLAGEVYGLADHQGINLLKKRHEGLVQLIPWNDELLLLDVDTPADYDRLRELLRTNRK